MDMLFVFDFIDYFMLLHYMFTMIGFNCMKHDCLNIIISLYIKEQKETELLLADRYE